VEVGVVISYYFN